MRFAYCRVSTADQNPQRQIHAMLEQGIEERNIFVDKASGAKESRPALDDLLSRLREGDSVTVSSFDRLARSTRQLLNLCERFEKEGVQLISLKENIDTSTAQGRFFYTVMSAVAELERSLILERQAEALALMKAEGRSCGRPKVNPDKMKAAVTLYKEGRPVREITEVTTVSRASLYRELKRLGAERGATA